MYECIYCRQLKEKTQFNREHVVPRMMGTYMNGFVLNSCQVCEECNSYFSRELEDKIALNSYESFLRMRHGRAMSDGRTLRSDRTTFMGTSGVFNGLKFTPVVDNGNPERIHMEIDPCIGIASQVNENEYNYYSIEELPNATPEILSFLRGNTRGIITVGITQQDALPVLQSKGYLSGDYQYSEPPIGDLYAEDSLLTNIRISVDSIVRRICAKTVFNYLCYKEGSEFVLNHNFDELRNYIRYGIWSDKIQFRYSRGPVSSVETPNRTAHVVGYMYAVGDKKWNLMGCVTWFGETTYCFTIGETEFDLSTHPILLPVTKMSCFNNEDRTITEDEAVHIFGGSLAKNSEI